MKTWLKAVVLISIPFIYFACGSDDATSALKSTGACTISVTSGDDDLVSCLEYVDQATAVVDSAKEQCTDAGTWVAEACSRESSIGICSKSQDGVTATTVYSGSGFTAEAAETACDSQEGTFTAS